jgi:hypothetical protein
METPLKLWHEAVATYHMLHEARRKETPSSTRGKKPGCLCTETIMLCVSGDLSLVAELLFGTETGFVGSAPLVVYPHTAAEP